MTNNTLFIIDQSKEFSGYALSTITPQNMPLSETLVDYTGLTFDEYNQQHGGNLVAMDWDTFHKTYMKPYLQSLCKPFEEITEEEYYYKLNVLPPSKWRDISERFNVFFICEAWTADLHSCVIKDRLTGKYYTALRSIHSTNQQLIESITESIN